VASFQVSKFPFPKGEETGNLKKTQVSKFPFPKGEETGNLKKTAK
jgi:hypothetical protein